MSQTCVCLETMEKSCRFRTNRRDCEGIVKKGTTIINIRSNTSSTLKATHASPKIRKDKDAEKREKKKEKDEQLVSSPFNLVHNTHVDFDFNWSGDTDPNATLDFKEELGRGYELAPASISS